MIPFKLKGIYDRNNSFIFDYETNGILFGFVIKRKPVTMIIFLPI